MALDEAFYGRLGKLNRGDDARNMSDEKARVAIVLDFGWGTRSPWGLGGFKYKIMKYAASAYEPRLRLKEKLEKQPNVQMRQISRLESYLATTRWLNEVNADVDERVELERLDAAFQRRLIIEKITMWWARTPTVYLNELGTCEV